LILLKSPTEVREMVAPGEIAAGAHRKAREAVRPGVTTGEIDRIVEAYIRERGASPAFKGYRGFPPRYAPR
jgi:methionyl aminopeptidase